MQTVKMGEVYVSALIDGNVMLPASMLFPEVAREDWAPFKPSFIDADDQLPLSLGAFLVSRGDHHTLVDTGVGLAAEAFGLPSGGLAQGLAEKGLRPTDISLVILTHMHADHIGGATIAAEGTFTPLYPKATYIVAGAEWNYWLHDARSTSDPSMTPALLDACAAPLEASGQLKLIDGAYNAAPHLTVLPAPGHTPGHCSVLVKGGEEQMMIIGDAAHCPAQVIHPNWSIYAGVDKELERRSRGELFDRIEREGMIVGAGHYFACNFGRFVRRDGVRSFVPIAG